MAGKVWDTKKNTHTQKQQKKKVSIREVRELETESEGVFVGTCVCEMGKLETRMRRRAHPGGRERDSPRRECV